MANFEEFTKLVEHHRQELKASDYSNGSVEEYLLNHLGKLASNANSSSSAKEVVNSMNAVMRFATDSIEWNSELLKRVTEISDYHSSLLKAESR